MRSCWPKLLHAARRLWRNPRFAVTVLAVLTLGVGTVSALFSVIDRVLLEPLPYADPGRLVELITTTTIGDQDLTSIPKYLLWRDLSTSFDSMAASNVNVPEMNFEEGPYRSTLRATRVSADYFYVFGATMVVGRTFSASEDSPGGPKVVVITNELWRRYFHSDANLVGRRIALEGVPHIVVGVLAADTHLESPADVWLPLRADPNSVDLIPRVRVVARLRQGIPAAKAQNELNKLFKRTEWDLASQNFGDTFTAGFSKVITLRDAVVGDVRPSLYILMGAAAFALAICCLNIATLFLARSKQRMREIAVRMALGATRRQVASDVLMEGLLLSFGVALGSSVLGYLGVHAVLALSPDALPRVGANGSAITLDWRVFLFTLTVSLLTGILCAAVPALNASQTDINLLVNDSAARSGMTLGRDLWNSAVIVAEMSFSLLLLVGAGLLMHTFVAKRAIGRGFDERNIVTFDMSLNSPRFDETTQVWQMVRYAASRIERIPGVEAVATTNALPLFSSVPMPFSVIEHEQVYGHFNGTAIWRSISPEYFKVFRIRLLRGRMFTDGDDENAARVVVINRAMMHRYWQQTDANPIGHFIHIGEGWQPDPPREIVGVVADVQDAGLDRDPAMYVPVAQVSDWMNARDNQLFPLIWTVRLDEPETSRIGSFQQELISLSGGQPVARPLTMHEAVAVSSARYEFYLTVLALFSAIALVLTASGLYGLMACSVERRQKELAIRAALGATPLDVQAIVIKEAIELTGYGVLAGIPLALGLTRVTVSSIFGVEALNPMVLAFVVLSLCVVSLLAAYVPSVRASRLDPGMALRSDS
jgi:putative ABC transport system permease protein